MKSKVGLGAARLGLFLTVACGSADHSTSDVGVFLAEHEVEVVKWIQDEYRKGQYSQLLHIDFAPNDFGSDADAENGDRFSGLLNEGPRRLLAEVKLRSDATALSLRADFSNTSILASMRYRHNSRQRALKALEQVFTCRNGKALSPEFKRTFILGSGGSHGADELDTFSHLLTERCGRGVNFAIVGDAIARPGPFAKTSFRHLSGDRSCIHFYQRQDLLAGLPMEGCVNVKIESDTDHYSAAEMGRRVSLLLLERLVFESDRWTLAPISTSSQAFYFQNQYLSAIYSRDSQEFFRALLSPHFSEKWAALKRAADLIKSNPADFVSSIYDYSEESFPQIIHSLSSMNDPEATTALRDFLIASSDPRERASTSLIINWRAPESAPWFRRFLDDSELGEEFKRELLVRAYFAGPYWVEMLDIALDYDFLHASLARSLDPHLLIATFGGLDFIPRSERLARAQRFVQRLEVSDSADLRLRGEAFAAALSRAKVSWGHR